MGLRRGYEERQRRAAEEARVMATAHAAAEQASAAKSQFLANMSHELRTPLNAIIGYAQLLKGAEVGDRERSAITTIEHSGEHLLAMISDILDIAKVEAGRLELLPAVFDLRACIDTVGQMIRLRAEEKGLLFRVAIADDIPRTVLADQKRVRQVLINLLGNAVKFTASGEVRLEVSVTGAHDGDVRLRFDIVDTGVGIPQDHIGRIFRPFEQAGNAIDRSSGTGLGLAITNQIVQMMGGDIRVESTQGEGSRFIVEAPFQLSDANALPDAAPAVLEAPVTPSDAAADSMVAPAGETLERLLVLSRTGNLRAIRKEIPAIAALGPQYRPFAERLDALCAAYQSPAVLRLVEQVAQERTVA
jgi:signal transduction histidine kinase